TTYLHYALPIFSNPNNLLTTLPTTTSTSNTGIRSKGCPAIPMAAGKSPSKTPLAMKNLPPRHGLCLSVPAVAHWTSYNPRVFPNPRVMVGSLSPGNSYAPPTKTSPTNTTPKFMVKPPPVPHQCRYHT